MGNYILPIDQESPLVSVIIPVYNVEKYLCFCLDSVLDNTYTNYEVILIDDGSSDKSGMICDNYAKNDGRIRVFHQANGGAAKARNYGIQNARGKYFTFVDADDYVGKDYLKILVSIVLDYQVKIASIKGKPVPENFRQFVPDNDVHYLRMSKEEALREVVCGEGKMGVAPWGKLFHRDLWEEIMFPAGVRYEDLITTPYVFARCNAVVWCDSIQYYYRSNPFSLTHRKIDTQEWDIIENVKQLQGFISEQYPQLNDAANVRLVKEHLCYIVRLIDSEDYYEKIKRLKSEYEEDWRKALHNTQLTFHYKIQIMFIILSPPLFRIIRKFYLKVSH